MTNSIRTKVMRAQSILGEFELKVQQLEGIVGQEQLRAELAYLLYVSIDDQCKRTVSIDIDLFNRTLELLLEKLERALENNRKEKLDKRIIQDTSSAEMVEFTKELWGRTWSVVDKEAFISSAGFLKERFELNGLKTDFIKGLDCLDFGCGSGRYCLALLELCANSVHGVDFSPSNIDLAQQRIEELSDKKNIRFEQGDITRIFQDVDGAYDFIVAQGIISCLEAPIEALHILYRILKPGGKLYLFAYGSTERGVYWKLFDVVRLLLKPVPMGQAQEIFESLKAKSNHISSMFDGGYATFQHRFIREDIEIEFESIGFQIVKTMNRGKIYETNERVFRYPQEELFWGNEELRYLLRKV